jgi:hypothetical protein
MYTKAEMGLCKTANLTAKPAILSTIQCMSAIQHNTREIVPVHSQAAPTPLANLRRETPVPIPNTEAIPFFHSESIAANMAATPMISDD